MPKEALMRSRKFALSTMLAVLLMCGFTAISGSVYADTNPAETAVNFEVPPVGKLDQLSFSTIEKAPSGTWFHRLNDESKFTPENGYGGVDSWAITLLKGPSDGTWTGVQPARTTHSGTNWCIGVLTNSSFKSQLLGNAEATFAMHVAVPEGTFIAVSGNGQVKTATSNGLNSIILPDDGIVKVCASLPESGDTQIVWSAYESSNTGVIDLGSTAPPPPTNGSAVDNVNNFELPLIGSLEGLPASTVSAAQPLTWFHRVYNPELFGPPAWEGADSWQVALAVSNPSGWTGGQPAEVVYSGPAWCIAFHTNGTYAQGTGRLSVKLSMQSGSAVAVKDPFGVVQTAVSNDGGNEIVLPAKGVTKVCVTGNAPGASVSWNNYDPSNAFNVIDASQRPNLAFKVFMGGVAR